MDLKQRYYTVLDALPDYVFVFSQSGVYLDVFGGEESATGFDCKPFIGRSLYEVAPPEMAKQFHSYIQTALDTNQAQIVRYKFDTQNMIELPDGVAIVDELWFEGLIKPLPLIDNGERTVVWTAKNITERHLLELRLKELSEKDDLTGIANRRMFTESLVTALENYRSGGRTFSLLMIDIDRFKSVNDTMGHNVGDEAIRMVAQRLFGQLKHSDGFGRIGGEEFSAILFDINTETAKLVAEKLRISLADSPLKIDSYQVPLTISIGVTQVNADDIDIKSILSRADEAMYRSKRLGRNRVTIYGD
ncbi:GGDEF domain-containing protein [Vibrio sp. JPW-9-11-11]|uniref:sensor domain-containing diguanylate cyclase n=1 Tax=Vibrio sp. JPW-9-11-11 TaxID=1416532 RepID=UPI00159372B5|nr:GGDEF domain-containing protein [Vibrio sp. JPW-9-11-11]NVD06503.1 GGDEF domain-containing protein [Vibrio sp. JPW-9-11-11]